jgi:hypothetical protein
MTTLFISNGQDLLIDSNVHGVSYAKGLTRTMQLRLANNLPDGYSVDDVANLDRGVESTKSKKHLIQSTALGLRQQTAADTRRCIRQYFVHTVSVNVPNSDRVARADIMTTVSEILNIFEKVEINEYKTQTATIDVVGKLTDSKFYRVDVNVNGYYEEIL